MRRGGFRRRDVCDVRGLMKCMNMDDLFFLFLCLGRGGMGGMGVFLLVMLIIGGGIFFSLAIYCVSTLRWVRASLSTGFLACLLVG